MIDIEVKVIPKVDTTHKFVTVLLDNRTPMIRKDLHCVNCGRIVFNYYSEVKIIILGEMRQVSRPTDVMCSRCGTLHRIA